jgi:hypothetical protein
VVFSGALLIEGDFTLVDFDPEVQFESIPIERIIIEQKGKPTTRLVDVLKPALGENIVFSMHHVPVAMNPFRWGGGNCIWQPYGWCPAGHHLDPLRFFSMNETGVLEEGDGKWWLHTFAGKNIDIPFHVMVGHFGRIAAATMLDMEKMRDELSKTSSENLEAVGVSAKELSETLEKLLK